MIKTLLVIGQLITVILFGEEQGVGPGVLVAAQRGDVLQLCHTDLSSRCDFFFEYGTIDVVAYPPGGDFLRWDCRESIFLDEPQEGLEVNCVARFGIYVPFLRKWIGE